MVNSERGALITSNSSGIKPRKVSETDIFRVITSIVVYILKKCDEQQKVYRYVKIRSSGVAENYAPCSSQMKQEFTYPRGRHHVKTTESSLLKYERRRPNCMQGNTLYWSAQLNFIRKSVFTDNWNDIVSGFGSLREIFACFLDSLLYILKQALWSKWFRSNS